MLPKTRRRFESLESSLDFRKSEITSLQGQIWELRGKFKRLEEHLGIIQVETHKVEYTKKGGPEKE